MYKFFLPFFLLLLNINLFSQNSAENYYSPQNRLAFAENLFGEKDYLRAIDEYLSYLQSGYNDTVVFKIAYGFEKLGKQTKAVDYYRSLFFNSSLEEQARLRYYKNSFEILPHDEFVDLYNEGRFLTKNILSEVASLKNISQLYQDSFKEDSTEFYLPFNIRYKEDLRKFYHRKLNPEYKNPTKAALLSAIIPGLGKIYTENYTDGFTALLVTGIFGYLAYDNFRADHDFRAWLFTGLAAYFYAGNIYGSYAAVDIYNAGIRLSFNNDLDIFVKKNNYFLPVMKFTGEK